jgi:hypothetical protein
MTALPPSLPRYQSYSARATHSVNGSGCFVCLATSTDGETWLKSRLGVLKLKVGLDINTVWAPSPKMYFCYHCT